MIPACAFQLQYPGSNGDTPWVDAYCYVEPAVPQGCPLHIVSADPIDPAQVTVDRWHGYNDPITQTPSTTTLVGTLPEHVGTSHSPCDCDVSIDTTITFSLYEIAAPALVQGDSFDIRYKGADGGVGGATSVAPPIDAPGTCPAPTWPTQFVAQCGCGGDAGLPVDQPTDAQPADSGGGPGHGCDVGGDPSLVIAALSALAAITRRRRAVR